MASKLAREVAGTSKAAVQNTKTRDFFYEVS